MLGIPWSWLSIFGNLSDASANLCATAYPLMKPE